MLTNQLWLPLFSILLSGPAVRLHHASSHRLTSIFPASWQSLKASESYTKKAFARNNEVIIIIIITTVEPRLYGHQLSGLFDYPDFFSGPVFFMNINDLRC